MFDRVFQGCLVHISCVLQHNGHKFVCLDFVAIHEFDKPSIYLAFSDIILFECAHQLYHTRSLLIVNDVLIQILLAEKHNNGMLRLH